ncbi:MAG: hypothetical protein Q4B43_07765 [Bacteroidota bacterium]|nr:hypothetical protein [Bacteroidota bacterium]
MTTIAEIYEKLDQFGTFMSIDDELIIMSNLESLDIAYIEQNRDKICDIIDWLRSSHMDTYDEVDETNIEQIKVFLQWLKRIGEKTSIKKDFIDSKLKIFSINIKDDNENVELRS